MMIVDRYPIGIDFVFALQKILFYKRNLNIETFHD